MMRLWLGDCSTKNSTVPVSLEPLQHQEAMPIRSPGRLSISAPAKNEGIWNWHDNLLKWICTNNHQTADDKHKWMIRSITHQSSKEAPGGTAWFQRMLHPARRWDIEGETHLPCSICLLRLNLEAFRIKSRPSMSRRRRVAVSHAPIRQGLRKQAKEELVGGLENPILRELVVGHLNECRALGKVQYVCSMLIWS